MKVKTTLSTPDQDSNLDLLVIGSLVYCVSNVLDHVTTEIGDTPNPELRIITSTFGKVQYKAGNGRLECRNKGSVVLCFVNLPLPGRRDGQSGRISLVKVKSLYGEDGPSQIIKSLKTWYSRHDAHHRDLDVNDRLPPFDYLHFLPFPSAPSSFFIASIYTVQPEIRSKKQSMTSQLQAVAREHGRELSASTIRRWLSEANNENTVGRRKSGRQKSGASQIRIDGGMQVIEGNDNESNVIECDDDEEMDVEETAGPSHSDAYKAFQTTMNWLERKPEGTATQLVLLKRLRDMAAKKHAPLNRNFLKLAKAGGCLSRPYYVNLPDLGITYLCESTENKDQQMYRNFWGGIVENHFLKTTLITLERDSNLNSPVISSLVYCENSTLDHVTTELYTRHGHGYLPYTASVALKTPQWTSPVPWSYLITKGRSFIEDQLLRNRKTFVYVLQVNCEVKVRYPHPFSELRHSSNSRMRESAVQNNRISEPDVRCYPPTARCYASVDCISHSHTSVDVSSSLTLLPYQRFADVRRNK
uniref:Uncharacterized protein n=1 Tax=Timema shepardi TaxID=629360 RepID=A0A7R9ARF7_TIMSH|nr:unnamed protein product [Timema shepardi]